MKRDFFLFGTIALLAFFLLRQCQKDQDLGGSSTTIIKTDTLRVISKGEPDTVFYPVEKIVYLDKKPDKVEVIADTLTDGSIDSVHVYETQISDSLIDAIIFSKVKGSLISSSFEYNLKGPRFITRIDTFRETITNEVIKPRTALSAGVILGGSAGSFSVEPTLMLETKKSLRFTVGFDLIGKEYKVGILTKIKRPALLK